jgi:hypothetical protein
MIVHQFMHIEAGSFTDPRKATGGPIGLKIAAALGPAAPSFAYFFHATPEF